MLRIRLILLSLLAVFAVGAIASASASAACLGGHLCVWEVQATEGGAYAKVAAGEKLNVEDESVAGAAGEFILKAGTAEVKCKKVESYGTIEETGKDIANVLRFTGCTTGLTGCKVKSKGTAKVEEIVSTKIKTQLVTRGTGNVLADEFKGKGAGEEFVTLEFGKKQKPLSFKMEEVCGGGYPATTQVIGEIAEEVINVAEVAGVTPAQVESIFPATQLAGNTLEAFGVAATLTGKTIQKLVPGEGFGSRGA
jgi:hypothetical protein